MKTLWLRAVKRWPVLCLLLTDYMQYIVVALVFAATLAWAGWLDVPDVIVLAVIWNEGALWGALTTAANLSDTHRDLGALKRSSLSNDKALLLIAEANRRREVLRLAGFLVLLLLGVSVLFNFSTAFGARALLIILVALLIANAVLDRAERRRTSVILRRAVAHHDHQEKQ